MIRETLPATAGWRTSRSQCKGWDRSDQPHGTAAQKLRYLSGVATGEAIPAFALSEPELGSDVAAMPCSARIDGNVAVINGQKTWISNGGVADFYVVFACTGEDAGARGISACCRRRRTKLTIRTGPNGPPPRCSPINRLVTVADRSRNYWGTDADSTYSRSAATNCRTASASPVVTSDSSTKLAASSRDP